MKQTGVLFNKAMVLALLAGTKTQTRRIVNGTALDWLGQFTPEYVADPENRLCPYGKPGDVIYVKESHRFERGLDALPATQIAEKCIDAGYKTPWAPIEYEADHAQVNWQEVGTPNALGTGPRPGKLRPSIFLPKWAARIWLELAEVRVERLQDITEADAVAEGTPGGHLLGYGYNATAVEQYFRLWGEINGTEGPATSVAANPWVWVYTLRRLPCRPA